jgi:putative hydrolase of the HAD superfamily
VSISIPGRVVVFDYGEVISRSPSDDDRAALVALAGIDEAVFWESYWRHRDALDQGSLSVAAYWARIAEENSVEWSASRVYELWVADFRSWWSVEPGTLDLIARLHAGGTRLAILSNAGFDFGSGFRFSPLGQYVERVFVSAEMDAIKPDPAIYREVADELGIPLSDMVFIDNKSINTDAASALGVTAHHFTGVAGLAAFLSELAA